MLRLKEVELLGFKSFADRTRFVCDGTTAAVVGPNGCGKSNLSDAVSWVLGEQSARVLRGERMSDVIFNGTGTRPPTGLAEVTITLVEVEESAGPADDLEKMIGIAADDEQSPGEGNREAQEGASGSGAGSALGSRSQQRRAGDEIRVTRRLFRSGESEYLLNGEQCRLRDIQDIFRGTGLGPESYAIIEQGRIGQILSSKPSDRRLIIEEAAGVSKFKSRKRLAEAKLESSRQNLSRINDILEEVSKQVNSLKRQASKAERHRELRDALRSRQRLAVVSRLAVLDAECVRWQAGLAAIQEECSTAHSNLGELEGSRNRAASEYERIEEDVKRSREELAANELESERTGRRLDHLRQQAAVLAARHADAEGERLRLSEQAQALEAETAERQAQASQVRSEWAAAQAAVSDLTIRRAELAQSLEAQEALAEERRQAALAAVSRASEIRNESVKAEEMALSSSRELARVEAERAAAEEERDRFASGLAASQAEHQRNEEALQRLGDAAAEARRKLEIERTRERALRADVERLGEEFAQASARRSALEESLARHAYSTESVRSLLSASNSDAGGFRALGVMADFVEVSPGFETPVEELLRADLDRVVVNSYEEARAGIALLEREGRGRCAFFVLNAPASAPGGVELEPAGRQGVVAALTEMIRCDARLGMSGMQAFPALARSFLAGSPADAERLAAEFPACNFITREGELYHGRCVSGGKTSSGGPLALRRDFRELERRTSELETALDQGRRLAAEALARVEEQDEALRRLEAERLKLEKEAALASEKVRQGEDLIARCGARIGSCLHEASRLRAERAAAEELRRSLETQEAAAQRGKEEYGREAAAAVDSARGMRLVLDETGTALSASQMRSSALEERWKAAESDRARVSAEAVAARDRLAHLAAESDQWRADYAQLEADAASAEAYLSEARLAHESMRVQLQAREEESRETRGLRDELAPQVDAARSHLDALREKRGGVEVAQARAAAGLEHNSQQCQEELGISADALRAETPASDLLEGEALELAESDVRALKEKIDRLGPVNMMALDELQEASERLTFLDTQRQDLLASIEDTAQSIREIDAVSRRRFLDAFAAINGFFSESFRALFGGGAAEMRFSDEADPDSGIDLVVQPPGKRLQNVLLLSGGEKALTALALLIAVFRYSPSPFCILDEVDAPLDEANVVRFAQMIQKLSEQTQFIIITHNKRTMEACPMIYGVTMEEAGVSRLVSVRFTEHAPEPVEVVA